MVSLYSKRIALFGLEFELVPQHNLNFPYFLHVSSYVFYRAIAEMIVSARFILKMIRLTLIARD